MLKKLLGLEKNDDSSDPFKILDSLHKLQARSFYDLEEKAALEAKLAKSASAFHIYEWLTSGFAEAVPGLERALAESRDTSNIISYLNRKPDSKSRQNFEYSIKQVVSNSENDRKYRHKHTWSILLGLLKETFSAPVHRFCLDCLKKDDPLAYKTYSLISATQEVPFDDYVNNLNNDFSFEFYLVVTEYAHYLTVLSRNRLSKITIREIEKISLEGCSEKPSSKNYDVFRENSKYKRWCQMMLEQNFKFNEELGMPPGGSVGVLIDYYRDYYQEGFDHLFSFHKNYKFTKDDEDKIKIYISSLNSPYEILKYFKGPRPFKQELLEKRYLEVGNSNDYLKLLTHATQRDISLIYENELTEQ